MDALTSHLRPEVDPDIQTTVADVIKAIIAISANSSDQGVIGPNALSRNLVSGPTISGLVRNMTKVTDDGTNASLTTGVSIVIELIRKNNSDYDMTPVMVLAYNNQPPTSRDPIYLGTMLRVFADAICDFQALLLSPKNVRMIRTSGYGEIESLGFERFRICELYAELLHCSNMALLNDMRGESVVRERDAERGRLKAMAKSAKNSEMKTTRHTRSDSSGEIDTEKDNASNFGDRSTSSHHLSALDDHDELEDAFMSEKEHRQGANDLTPSLEQRRRSSSEERRPRPEERRRSRGSFDEESRPYMPAIQQHQVIEGVAIPDSISDEEAEEQKIIADIGPQSHPVPKPETAQSELPRPEITLDGSAIESRTPSPPTIASDLPLSPSGQNGAPLSREPTSIEQDISRATQETLLPGDAESLAANIDLNIDLDNIATTIAVEQIPDEEDDCSTPRAVVAPPSDTSDTLSITSTTSSQAPSEPFEPVIGDYLKMQFMNQHVISTILGLFFKFPWNNFLHNVVYDVVQQIFNGPMDRGYNRVLAIDVFAHGQLCEKIVAGQKASDDHVAGDGVRLGYMGHLTLISEEVVKFVEQYPPHQISPLIAEKVSHPDWIDYVENTLAATRARDSAILGGKRPLVPTANVTGQAGTAAVWGLSGDRPLLYDANEDDEELQRRMGQFGISQDGTGNGDAEGSDQFAEYISQQISNDVPDKFGSSDEEDEDDEPNEWMNDQNDFLRARVFDRYEHEDIDDEDEEEEGLLEGSPGSPHNLTFDNHGEPISLFQTIPSGAAAPMGEGGDGSGVRGGGIDELEDLDGEHEKEILEIADRAPTPEGGPLPQSARSAPERRSIDDDEDDDDDDVL